EGAALRRAARRVVRRHGLRHRILRHRHDRVPAMPGSGYMSGRRCRAQRSGSQATARMMTRLMPPDGAVTGGALRHIQASGA
ncbi:hypothetical protein, partial [Nguyenibacter vanlangensis]|uniref:hypothetical protein n=1 Tax=Nguyenibacter vanlangensis TaxID=1216886 RepID=UPI001C400B18